MGLKNLDLFVLYKNYIYLCTLEINHNMIILTILLLITTIVSLITVILLFLLIGIGIISSSLLFYMISYGIIKTFIFLFTNTFTCLIIGAFLSYYVYRWFSVKNLKKYLKNQIIYLYGLDRKLDFRFPLDQVERTNIMIKTLIEMCQDADRDLWKMTGKKDIYFTETLQKLTYVQIELMLIDQFITLYTNRNTTKSSMIKHTNIDVSNLLNDIRTIRFNDSTIQNSYDQYKSTYKNGHENYIKDFRLIEQ